MIQKTGFFANTAVIAVFAISPICMRIGRVTIQGCLAMNERINIRHCEEHGDEQSRMWRIWAGRIWNPPLHDGCVWTARRGRHALRNPPLHDGCIGSWRSWRFWHVWHVWRFKRKWSDFAFRKTQKRVTKVTINLNLNNVTFVTQKVNSKSWYVRPPIIANRGESRTFLISRMLSRLGRIWNPPLLLIASLRSQRRLVVNCNLWEIKFSLTLTINEHAPYNE